MQEKYINGGRASVLDALLFSAFFHSVQEMTPTRFDKIRYIFVFLFCSHVFMSSCFVSFSILNRDYHGVVLHGLKAEKQNEYRNEIKEKTEN